MTTQPNQTGEPPQLSELERIVAAQRAKELTEEQKEERRKAEWAERRQVIRDRYQKCLKEVILPAYRHVEEIFKKQGVPASVDMQGIQGYVGGQKDEAFPLLVLPIPDRLTLHFTRSHINHDMLVAHIECSGTKYSEKKEFHPDALTAGKIEAEVLEAYKKIKKIR